MIGFGWAAGLGVPFGAKIFRRMPFEMAASASAADRDIVSKKVIIGNVEVDED
jgi:hypothetical protein